MNKLLVFGCSLSATGHLTTWSDQVKEHYDVNKKDIELLNFAVPASSNILQIKRFQEYVVNNNIGPDDVIMWQVTGSERGHKRISNRLEKESPQETRKLMSYKNMYYSGAINYFDQKRRVDLLCHHPSCVGINIDEEEVLQELLFCFRVAKKFTNRVLVFVGWDEAVSAEHSKKFTDFLNDSNISFINESLLSYTKRNGLPVLPDGTHPGEDAYISYADNMIVPLIKKLGWL
jgi:hypothetical protein